MHINFNKVRRKFPHIVIRRAVCRKLKRGLAKWKKKNLDKQLGVLFKDAKMIEIFENLPRFDLAFLIEIQKNFDLCESVSNLTAWRLRFEQLASAVAKGKGTYKQVEEHIFELKLIAALAASRRAECMVYEPVGEYRGGKNCDFSAVIDGDHYLVEMKCFHPEWRDAQIPQKYIAENNKVIMNGPVYHQYQAVRGHLVDQAAATEEKILNYKGKYINVMAVPVGFYLDVEDLRDFVYIYRNGHPRRDDPLGPMTIHNLPKPFSGTINQFWALPFMQESFYFKPNEKPVDVDCLMGRDRRLEFLV